MKKTWIWVIEYKRIPQSDYDRKEAARAEKLLTAHPELDQPWIDFDSNEAWKDYKFDWYARDLVRWTPISERHLGKYAYGPRDQPMSPKHFNVAQEMLIHLVYHGFLDTFNRYSNEKILDVAKYLTRLRNTKTNETIPGEIYAI